MKIELAELTWIDEQGDCSLGELAEHARLPETEILELMECGAIPPRAGRALAAARTAARLRRDFELDLHGLVLAMTLLRRIDELEAELARLRAHKP